MFDNHLSFGWKAVRGRVFGDLRAAVSVALVCTNLFPGYGFAQEAAGQAGAAAGASTGQSGSASQSGSTGQSGSTAQSNGATGPTTTQQTVTTQSGPQKESSTQAGPQKEAAPDLQPAKVSAPQVVTQEPAVASDPNSPQGSRTAPPYNLPSLTDLYSQLPSGTEGLGRFGADTFRNGSGNGNDLPMDLPVGPDYVLGTGDALSVNMWGGYTEKLTSVVDRQGQLDLADAGTVLVNGLTIAAAQTVIQHALDKQFQGEHVEISLGRVRSVRVYVVGEVQRPGAYDVSSLSTPMNALYTAGGPTARGSMRVLRHYRGQQLVRTTDLYDFLMKGIRSDEERLLPGDTLMVPMVGPLVAIAGAVRRPAVYELNGEKGLNQVVDLAGGVLISAALKQIEVERIEDHQNRTMFSLQLPENLSDVQQKLASFSVKDGDRVEIKQILPYNAQTVYLEGHVYRPGKYAYREGMTITDVVRSYQDVMPEPSDSAELIRLVPPDFHPDVVPFKLADVLSGRFAIPLQPFDVISINGRYGADGPKVTITGQVARPGDYPMWQGMTVGQLLKMAGGFNRSAYREEADLSSYTVQDDKRVQVIHTTVAAQRAMEGDKAADVVLKPGDSLNIKTLEGWQDIGATITISGEVEHAGGYGIVPGERLSSVLKRAGGLRADAYPYAAVLERVQVQQLAQQAREKLIQRIEETPVDVKPGAMTAQAASEVRSELLAQRQEILTSLRQHPANGRMVITITSDISKWENTSADIELQQGDTLVIPKRPSFVQISGQVYNPIAIGYTPGKAVGWYLRKAGGVTPTGNKGDIYVLRADGSVVPRGGGLFGAKLNDVQLRRGDVIFVPEKVPGASTVWQNIVGVAQILSASTLPIAIALR